MTRFLMAMALVVAVGLPAVAGDGQVSDATLAAVGLSGMQRISDAQGLQVRGMSSNAWATSTSSVSVFLFDPNSGASFNFNATDFARATDENAGLNATSSATVNSGAAIAPANIAINTNGNIWNAIWAAPLNAFGLAMATSP